jgi:hypothetical protein
MGRCLRQQQRQRRQQHVVVLDPEASLGPAHAPLGFDPGVGAALGRGLTVIILEERRRNRACRRG